MNFKGRIARGDTLIGIVLSLGSPDIAEMAARAGFDWVWIDLEHGPTALRDAQRMIQAVAGRAATIVRVPVNDPVWLKQVLDLGCDGVLVPMIRNASEAAAAVAACFYPPKGSRSVGFTRALDYGRDFQERIASANSELCVMLQIEHRDAVENIDSILTVPGVDALLVGPYDLSATLEVVGDLHHPRMTESMARIRRAAKSQAMPLGVFAADGEAARSHMDAGDAIVAVGSDALLLWQGMDRLLKDAGIHPRMTQRSTLG